MAAADAGSYIPPLRGQIAPSQARRIDCIGCHIVLSEGGIMLPFKKGLQERDEMVLGNDAACASSNLCLKFVT